MVSTPSKASSSSWPRRNNGVGCALYTHKTRETTPRARSVVPMETGIPRHHTLPNPQDTLRAQDSKAAPPLAIIEGGDLIPVHWSVVRDFRGRQPQAKRAQNHLNLLEKKQHHETCRLFTTSSSLGARGTQGEPGPRGCQRVSPMSFPALTRRYRRRLRSSSSIGKSPSDVKDSIGGQGRHAKSCIVEEIPGTRVYAPNRVSLMAFRSPNWVPPLP